MVDVTVLQSMPYRIVISLERNIFMAALGVGMIFIRQKSSVA
jgi:hypothetical protein